MKTRYVKLPVVDLLVCKLTIGSPQIRPAMHDKE